MDRSPPESSKNLELREQDKWLPIANVSRIMKNALPESAKVSKEAKECVQECVSEFVSFITSEASEKCSAEKRKTVNGEDILFAMTSLGFENYAEVLKIYLAKYREYQVIKQEKEGERKSTQKGSSGGGGNGGSSASVGLEDEDEDEGPEVGGGSGSVEDLLNTEVKTEESRVSGTDATGDTNTTRETNNSHSTSGGGGAAETEEYATYDETTYTNTGPAPEDTSIYEDYGQYTNVDMNQF